MMSREINILLREAERSTKGWPERAYDHLGNGRRRRIGWGDKESYRNELLSLNAGRRIRCQNDIRRAPHQMYKPPLFDRAAYHNYLPRKVREICVNVDGSSRPNHVPPAISYNTRANYRIWMSLRDEGKRLPVISGAAVVVLKFLSE